jgi:NitT/TauT family transport system permease protein
VTVTVQRPARPGWTALPRRRPPRPRPALFTLKIPLSRRSIWTLTIASFALPLAAWWLLSISGWVQPASYMPTPAATYRAGLDLLRSGDLLPDLDASLTRVFVGFGLAVALSVPLGIVMGSFRSGWALIEPVLGLLRYLPAPAFVPLLFVWFGLGEEPKDALIFLGTFFFNTMMTADVVRNVPGQFVDAAYTLGARTGEILRKVIIPYSLPGMIDAVRVNAAAAWAMLVVAELLASENGLGKRINLMGRFQQVDKIFAILVVFGVIGVVTDVTLRVIRDRVGRWMA